jgi:hypothetical protein
MGGEGRAELSDRSECRPRTADPPPAPRRPEGLESGRGGVGEKRLTVGAAPEESPSARRRRTGPDSELGRAEHRFT